MKKESVPGILLFDDARYSQRKALEDAHGYFDVLSAARVERVNDAHFKGANEIGMVDLVCLTNAPGRTPGSLTADTDDDQDLTAALESLSNILVAAVLKKCGTDPKKRVDPDMWEAGFNALISLFCGGYSRNVTHYADKVKGPGAVKEIMAIAFDVYGEPDGKLRDDITSYLQKQGGLMEQMGYTGELNNPYTLIGFSSFVKDGKRRCAFTAYFTTFDVKTAKISRTCRETQKEFDFDFTVTHCNADFMVAS